MKHDDLEDLGYLLPVHEQWAVLQSMMDDLRSAFPAYDGWDPSDIDQNYVETMIAEGADAIRTLLSQLQAEQEAAQADRDDTQAEPAAAPDAEAPAISSSLNRSPSPASIASDDVSASSSAFEHDVDLGVSIPELEHDVDLGAFMPEPTVDFFDSDSDGPQTPTDRELFMHNLPVFSLYEWENREMTIVWDYYFDDIIARHGLGLRALAPGSHNIWAIGTNGRVEYVQRSPAMEWALYLREVCRALVQEPVVLPPAPNPHSPGSRSPVFEYA